MAKKKSTKKKTEDKEEKKKSTKKKSSTTKKKSKKSTSKKSSAKSDKKDEVNKEAPKEKSKKKAPKKEEKKEDPKKDENKGSSEAEKKNETESKDKKKESKKEEPKVKEEPKKDEKVVSKTKPQQKTEPPLQQSDQQTSRITELAALISGEKKLAEKNKEIERLKEEAKKQQKDKIRKDITEREVMLAVDPEYKPDEIEATGGARQVVQKINLFKWDAPIRVQFPFDTKVFTTVVIVALVFILYLAVLGHYGLMFAIIALLFFIYVAGTTEALNVTHYITTRGVDTMDKLYEWFMLGNFRFTKKNDQYMLIINTKLRAPTKLIMVVDKDDVTPIFLLLQDKLLYRDMRKQGWLDKATYGEYIRIEDI